MRYLKSYQLFLESKDKTIPVADDVIANIVKNKENKDFIKTNKQFN